jgi:hypothetical protein
VHFLTIFRFVVTDELSVLERIIAALHYFWACISLARQSSRGRKLLGPGQACRPVWRVESAVRMGAPGWPQGA